MEFIYALGFTLGIMLLISHYDEYIAALILRMKGHKIINAKIVGFANNLVSPYQFAYRYRSLIKVKYHYNNKEHTRLIFRDKNDTMHDTVEILIYPKYSLVVRYKVRRTYYMDSLVIQILTYFMEGLGWGIDIFVISIALWMIISHNGSLIFVIFYSVIITIFGISVSFWHLVEEQERIDKHNFCLDDE